MKILLFICAIWGSMYIDPSDGKKYVWDFGNMANGTHITVRVNCTSKCDVIGASVKSSSGNPDIYGGETIPGVFESFCEGYTDNNPDPCIKTSKAISTSTVYFHVLNRWDVATAKDVKMTVDVGNYKNSEEVYWRKYVWDFGNMTAGAHKTVRVNCTSTCDVVTASVESSSGNPDIYGGEKIPGVFESFCEGYTDENPDYCAATSKTITKSTVHFHVLNRWDVDTARDVKMTIYVSNYENSEEVDWTPPM